MKAFFYSFILFLCFSSVQAQDEISRKQAVEWTSLGLTGLPEGTESSKGNGQIHRITFDPQYNGKENQVVYAASQFGGLWRSNNNGVSWSAVNTDTQLQINSVADIAISHENNKHLFVCTGYGDGSVYSGWGPNAGGINPIHTVGNYRSLDGGISWHTINNGFIDHFIRGGVARRMISNPNNPNQLLIASSEGIFVCNNALDAQPVWTKTFTGLNDKELRGLEFKPGDSNKIYASGTDIYHSNNGGQSFESITGIKSGLVLQELPNQFTVNRINIAISPGGSDYLFAVIQGYEHKKNEASNNAQYIYRYDILKSEWKQLYYDKKFQSAPAWMGIVVHPLDPTIMFYGNTNLIGTRNALDDKPVFLTESPYLGQGFHADIHCLVFQPNVAAPELFCGHHGGISIKDIRQRGAEGWRYSMEGLEVSTFWSFDHSHKDEYSMIGGLQDNGVVVANKEKSGIKWSIIAGSDGFASQVGIDEENVMFFSSYGRFGTYYFDQKSLVYENIPKDEREKTNVKIPITFPVQNHPVERKPVFGFTELYTRMGTRGQAWRLDSDLNKSIPEQWRRQIIDFKISNVNPDLVYVVTGGLDNGPKGDWHLNPHLFKSSKGLSEGGLAFGTFEDITDRLPKNNSGFVNPAIISSIELDPLNEKRLWVSFTGMDAAMRVWQSNDGGITWINADSQMNLKNFPVNTLLFDERSKLLFAGTDAGVFVLDERSNQWNRYGNIPHVRITELKLHHCSGKLRAATFGRGVWECRPPEAEYYKSSWYLMHDLTMSGPMVLHSNLHIGAGHSLTIYGKLMMPAGSKIILEPGAKLFVDGGTILNNCGEQWEGIEVMSKRRKKQHKDLRNIHLLNNGRIQNNRNEPFISNRKH